MFIYDWDGWILVNLGIARGLLRDVATWDLGGRVPRLAVVAAGKPMHLSNSGPRTFASSDMDTIVAPIGWPIAQIVSAGCASRPTS